jgi:hypothetical protein
MTANERARGQKPASRDAEDADADGLPVYLLLSQRPAMLAAVTHHFRTRNVLEMIARAVARS